MLRNHLTRLTPTSRRVTPAIVALCLVAGLIFGAIVIARPLPAHADGRDPWLWPFATNSIWNMPIGSNAQYVAANIPAASYVTGDDYYYYKVSASDPTRNVYAPGSFGPGRCTGTTFELSMKIADNIVVPDATPPPNYSTPNNGSAFLQLDGKTTIDLEPLARCQAGGNVYGYQSVNEDITGDGLHGADFGSGLSVIGGTIRQGELTGPNPIPHALKLEIWDNYLGACGLTLHGQTENGFRWPASNADGNACNSSAGDRYKGSNPSLVQGSLMAIPPNVTAASLGISSPAGIKLFNALQNYGGYIAEDTGWDDNQIALEQGVTSEFSAAYGYDFGSGTSYNEINALFKALNVVDNNSASNIGGGGTPRAPLAPPIGGSSTPTPTNTPTPGSGGSLVGSSAAASTSAYNLTTIGTTDWVHWGNGGYPGQDRKSGGSAISSVSTFGSGAATGNWSDPSRNYSWSNGTPTASATNNQSYIWDNGNTSTGFSFTVPADTTSRTLTVYAGGANGGVSGTLQASLSDNSATAYSSSFGPTGSSLLTNVYTVTYQAASAGQTLTITLTKTAGSSGGPSVDLIAAALSTSGGGSGSLNGSQAAAGSSYNLTSVGTSDWAHWGRGSTYGNFDHKSTGGSQISNVTTVGSGGNYGGWYDTSRSVSWTDGTPTGSVSGDNGYIWSNGSANTGFRFTVPASTTQHTLVIYAGGYAANTKLTAHLSDGSAADVVLTQAGTGTFTEVYTITFKAASAGQTLTITLLKTGEDGGSGGSADLDAAWLS